jgi:hypothetical protein
MKNSTSVKIPKKYARFIYSLDYVSEEEGGFFEMVLKECCRIDKGTGLYHYDTKEELLAELPRIYVIKTEAEFLKTEDADLLEDFRDNYKEIFGEYPQKG